MTARARILGLATGLLVLCAAYRPVSISLPAIRLKLEGKGGACSWAQAVAADHIDRSIRKSVIRMKPGVSVRATDGALGIDLVGTSERPFWIRRAGDAMPGPHLLSWLLAEQSEIQRTNPAEYTRRGDIVIDCGAHVGVYTHMALQRGAARVISVEPEPVNLECLRRNFKREIADGRVTVIPKAMSDRNGFATLYIGEQNSGMSSIAVRQDGRAMEVPLQTIDSLVEELGLARVDYIKMDIEGAERDALRGARATLARWKPRLMLDSYHLPGDEQVLPALIHGANSRYTQVCGFCQRDVGRLVPHVIFFH